MIYHHRGAECDGKEAFVSWWDAASIGKVMKRFGRRLHPYRCHFCRAFHLGRGHRMRPRR